MSAGLSAVSGVGMEQGAPRQLSPREQRIWLLEQLQPDAPLHVTSLLATMRGPLDREALREALTALIAGHPSLRTLIGSTDEGPIATVQPVEAAPIDLVELEKEGAADVPRWLEEAARRPFSVGECPLVRATLARLGDDTHTLLLSIHQLGCDPESAPRLLAELTFLYEQAVSGERVGETAETAETAETVAADQPAERQPGELAYWRGRLTDAPVLFELPTDRPRPPVQSFRGGRHSVVFGTALTAALDALDCEHGIDVRASIVTGLASLLHRYSGQTDLLLGTRAGVSDALAGGVNTVVLRIDVSDDPGFAELGRRVQTQIASAGAHASLPFERLVEDLDLERDLSRSPLFQTLVSYREDPPLPEVGAVRLQVEELFSGATPFDLSLLVRRSSGVLSASLDFSLDLFEPGTVERALGHLETLLVAAAAAPDTPVSRLPLLGGREREKVLEGWNATANPYPADRCLHQLIADQAARTPDAVAVRGVGGDGDDEELTYAALDAQANRLANHLRDRGAGPGDLVGILVDRRPALLVAMLGILKTGAAYVPLDPTYPRERLAFMLRDSAARLIVSELSLVELVHDAPAAIVLLDADSSEIAQREPVAPDLAHSSEQLAYVIYTSGSTGRPKGVEIEHSSVVNLLWHMRKQPGLGPGDVLVNLTNPPST